VKENKAREERTEKGMEKELERLTGGKGEKFTDRPWTIG
jgi:hypothetical protein